VFQPRAVCPLWSSARRLPKEQLLYDGATVASPSDYRPSDWVCRWSGTASHLPGHPGRQQKTQVIRFERRTLESFGMHTEQGVRPLGYRFQADLWSHDLL
jgi:hypothetical protein